MSGEDAPAFVVRGDSEASAVAAAVEDAGGVVAAEVAADVPFDAVSLDGDADDADAVLAVGEAALLSALDGETPPVLPVDAGYGRYSLDRSAVGTAVEAVRSGEAWTVRHPTVSVRVDGETAGRALTDVTLMTSEPARISEYSVAERRPSDGPTDAGGRAEVDSFRADGVVAATPLGSAGYARAAGGSVLDADAGLAVVPIAPYATTTDSWVLQSPVTLSVRRDDAAVSLILDDEVARDVPPDVPVEIDADGEIPLLRVPGSAGRTRS
ncbi:NAD(+)/NADH kinase [Halopelagius longus]|uniref:NAD(+)/NADH kinase n=1 Tax=Halopelagius longus TaxID=1236180 RepID=A0A1H1D363_9EURY|nr:NAD(+)/NADH kinase [Halopelagius longus]RDI71138.1 NAD(+)/NADH kinase [Halopelagius longus]SDQ70699.1 NAD+ kinase [Halopelagius longus]